MPRHKKKKRAAAKPAASGNKRDFFVGDLVVAKLRGHRPWPAQIQKPEDYGYDARPHRIFVTFFGTEETCFCSYNKITLFTSAVRKSLAEQLQKVNTNPELERAIKEIFAADDELKVSSKSLGTSQKEDHEMASEKSEEEEPPVERSRKRARVVEEVVPPVSVVDDRPAKQEKTVKSMDAEQVQKLPRKVRIKVSTGSDLPTPKHGAVQGLDKGGVSSSQASKSGGPPLRTSEPVDSAKSPAKNDDRTTTNKLDNSVILKERANEVVADIENISKHASENGGDATEKTEEDHATNSAIEKAENDGVKKMEVDDGKSAVSKSEAAVGEERDETSLATKTSEIEVGMEDESHAVEPPVSSETADQGVVTMELDDEKLVELNSGDKPTIGKEDAAIAEESVSTEGKEAMEVDEEKAKTQKPKEDEPVVGDPAGKLVKASNVSIIEPKRNESYTTAKDRSPQTVDDLEITGAGQEQVSSVSKEGLADPSRREGSHRESGRETDREGDGSEIKASSAVTAGVTDGAHSSASKHPVPVSKEEDIGEVKHGAKEAQMSISATKDDAAPRTDLHDGAVPGQSPRESTDQGEKFANSEGQASRLNQAGAVDRIVDRDRAVEKVEHHNGAVEKVEHHNEVVKKVEDREGDAKETEDQQDRAAKKSEEHETVAKKVEGQSAQVGKVEEQGTEMRKTEAKDVEMKQEDHPTEVTKREDEDAKVQAPKDQDGQVKKTQEEGAKVPATKDQEGQVKKTQDEGANVPATKDQEGQVKKTQDEGAKVQATKDQDGQVKKTQDEGAKVQARTEDKDAALKTILGKDHSVKKIEDTPELGSEESGVPTPASAERDAQPQSVSEKTVDAIPSQRVDHTSQVGTGNGAVLVKGKKEESLQSGAADVVEVTPSDQDATDEKRNDSSKEQPTTAA